MTPATITCHCGATYHVHAPEQQADRLVKLCDGWQCFSAATLKAAVRRKDLRASRQGNVLTAWESELRRWWGAAPAGEQVQGDTPKGRDFIKGLTAA